MAGETHRARRLLRQAFFLAAGAFSAAFGVHGFLLSSRFIDGGVTGISMLVAEVTGWPVAVLLPVLNLPFIVVGYRRMGRGFAVRSVAAIALLSLFLATVHFPDVTPDKLLTAVFGGLFIGAGIGLAIRGGGVLDGTEVAALLISRRSSLLRVGDVVLLFNVVIFVAAAFLLGVDSALYSILTYVAASRTLDFIVYGIEQYVGITVISNHAEEVRAALVRTLGRGVTVLYGEGGASGTPHRVLYCVATRLEIGGVQDAARAADRNAFIVIHPVSQATGGVLSRRHH